MRQLVFESQPFVAAERVRPYFTSQVKTPMFQPGASRIPLQKSFRKSTKRPASTAVQALRLAKTIKRKFEGEVKTIVTDVADVVDNAGRVDQLAVIGQGVTSATRVGNRIKIIRIKGVVVVRNITTPTNETRVRVCIVSTRGDDNSAPTWANTFEAAGSHGLIHSMRLWDKRRHKRVLYDQVVTIPINQDSGITECNFDINIPLQHVAVYDNAATTFEDNGLYLMSASNQTGASSPTFITHLRTWYVDN